MKLTATRIFEFDYAHWLPEYHGKCVNLHGHRGVLEVEVEKSNGIPSSYPSMVIDFNELDKIVKENVIKYLDHRCVNDFISIPTAENMVEWIVKKLQKIFGGSLVRVRLYETPKSYIEWRNDE